VPALFARWRAPALLAALFGPLAALLILPPIADDPQYYSLADTRALFGIPSFLNVASNAAFLVVGLIGFLYCVRRRPSGATTSWTLFFAGTALVAFGSGHYHWSPGPDTLVWDRLPMTIAFMGLFAALVSEHLGERLERAVLPAAIALGLGSVLWWHYTGDLRIYAWVQFAPLLAIVLLLALFPARYSHRSYLAYGLGFYVLAKAAEIADGRMAALTSGALSGHTLKHLLAALAPFCVYLMLRARRKTDIARGDAALKLRHSA
jgi:hypothetical protein